MSWVAVAIAGSALVNYYISEQNRKAADKATQAQLEAADAATKLQWKMFYQNREDLAPWREAGTNALNKLVDMVETGPGEFEASPGYQFRLGEGEQAINRALASRGQYDSGKAMKVLTRFNQDYATKEYDNFLARWYKSLTPFQSLAGIGQTTAEETAEMGANVARDAAANYLYKGNVRASGYINEQNINNQMYNNMAGAADNWLMWYYMNKNQGSESAGNQTIY
ncbi:MAG: hypothetical protein JW932_12590 [Deltaproteobacteria bacterium]|nr:hypothetical protein [Deltaproteobacteria bacterium]